jgi:hypothetical protein
MRKAPLTTVTATQTDAPLMTVTSTPDAQSVIRHAETRIEIPYGEWCGEQCYIKMTLSDLREAHPNIKAAARRAGLLV